MKQSKKSDKDSGQAKKPDTIEIIFRLQRMLVLDQIRCLEDFIRSFKVPPSDYAIPQECQVQSTTRTRTMAYRYRLYPDKEQKGLLAEHFGAVRWVYNHYLGERIRQYKETGHSDDYYAQANDLKRLKKQENTQWLERVNSQSLQKSLDNLDKAYKNFFKKRAKFPRFHSKYGKNSFLVPQNAKIQGDLLVLPKFDNGIPIVLHRKMKKMEGKLGPVTISKTATGEYYASFCVTEEVPELQPLPRAIGLDLGIKDLGITSDGEKFENLKHLKKYERKLAKAQQHLSRKKKGSKGYREQKLKVARIHEKIANCRKDYLHKCTLDLVRNYGVICIEDLNIRGLLKNHKLAKWIADASWGNFVRMLQYKADLYGRIVVKIDRFSPSTQTCSCCGYRNKATKDLKVRQWDCPKCGAHHDRDINSGINILNSGQEMLWELVEKTRKKALAQ